MRPFPRLALGSATLLALIVTTSLSGSPGSGGKLMFVTQRGENELESGRFSLGVMNATGTAAEILRDLGRDVDYTVLSPNRLRAGVLTDDGRLSVVDIRRGGSRLVAGGVNSWTWAPDSRRIAYSSAYKEGSIARISMVDVLGTSRRVLAHASRRTSKFFDPYNELAWSPNGKAIAFLNWQHYDWHHPPSGGRLYTVPVSGGSAVPGPRLGIVPSTLSWAPDSRSLAVAGFRDSGVLIVRGRSVNPLAGSDCCVAPGFLSWSPDGSHVAFLGADTSTAESGGVARIGATEATVFRGSENTFTRDPVWSPRGDHLAFLECRWDESYDSQGRCLLYQSDGDGHGAAQVRTTVKVDRLGAWTR